MKEYSYQIADRNRITDPDRPPAFDIVHGRAYATISEALAVAIEIIHKDFSDDVIREADIEVSVYTEDDVGNKSSPLVSFTLNDFRRAIA